MRCVVLALLFLLSVVPEVLAQASAPGETPPADSTPPTSQNRTAPEPRAVVPTIDDPMLETIPSPKNTLSSWRQALRLVRGRSSQLAIARAEVERASGRIRQAQAGALPTITGVGSVRRHLLFGTGTNLTADGPEINVPIPDPATLWTATLSVRQPVIAPKTWYDVGTSRRAEYAARLSVNDGERLVLASVAQGIVSVVTAERLAEVSRVSLQSALSTLDLTRRRARLGAASALDVLRAEQEVSLSRAQVVSATEGLRQARETLGMTLGFSEPWGVTPHIRLDALASDAQAVCSPIGDVTDRADVQASRVRMEVARRNHDSINYQFSPTLDLVSDLTYTTAPFTANGKPVQWTIGATLTIPFYDGGLRYSARTQSAADLDIAQQQLTEVQRQARVEARQAERAVNVAEANLAVSQRSRKIAMETSRLTRIAFLNGSGTSFDLVDAARRHREAEIDLAIKEFDVVRARILALLAVANCDI